MTEPYLIAHKVRGEAAFDIAERMRCPKCEEGSTDPTCECDGEGYWWIVSTSGHRARPWWNLPLHIQKFKDGDMKLVMDHNPTSLTWTIFPMPADWPDHFSINDRPLRASPEAKAKGRSILETLGLTKPKPTIVRRF